MPDILTLGVNTSAYVRDMAKAAAATKRLALQTNGLGTSLLRIRRSLNRAVPALQAFGGAARSVGMSLTRWVTAPILAMGAASVFAFAQFDKAIINSQAIMGDVGKDMDGRMRNLATTMSNTLPVSATQAGEAFYFLASAGLSAEQALTALPTVAKFSTAGMFDMAEATDLLTDAQSALGLTVKDSTQNMINMTLVADTLARASQLANATMRQLSLSLTTQAASAMRQMNIELADGVALLALYADQGIKGEKAGTLMFRGLNLITKAAITQKKAWEAAGISMFETNGELKDMVGIAETLESRLAHLTPEMRLTEMGLLGFQARSRQAIFPLIGMSGRLRELRAEIRSAAGALDEMVKKQLQSFWSQLRITMNTIQNFGRMLSASMAVPMRIVAFTVRTLFIALQWIPKPIKAVIVVIALLAASVGPLLVAFGTLTLVTAAYLAFQPQLILAYTILRKKMMVYTAAIFQNIFAMSLQEASAIIAIGGYGLLAKLIFLNTMAQIRWAAAQVWGAAATAVSTIWNMNLASSLGVVSVAFHGAAIAAAVFWTVATAGTAVAVVAVIGTIIAAFQGLMMFKDILADSFTILAQSFGATATTAAGAWDQMMSVVLRIWHVIKASIGAVLAFIVTTVVATVVTVIEVFRAMFVIVKAAMDAFMTLTGNTWESMAEILEEWLGFVVTGFNAAWSAASMVVKKSIDGMILAIKSMVGVMGMIPGMAGKARAAMAAIGQVEVILAINGGGGIIDKAKKDLADGAGRISDAWGKVKDVGGKAWNQIQDAWNGDIPGGDSTDIGGDVTDTEGRRFASLAVEGSVAAYQSEIRREGTPMDGVEQNTAKANDLLTDMLDLTRKEQQARIDLGIIF